MSIPPRSRALAASLLAIGLLGLIAEPRRAPAQGPSLIELSTRSSEDARIRLAVDADDSDEDGLPDAAELEGVPHQDLLELVINAAPSGAQVQVHGPVRLIDEGGRPSTRLEVRGRTRLWVQGLRASRRAGDARLHVQEGTREQSLEFTVVGMAWLDASNAPIDGTRQALRLSHRITNDTSLPLYPSWDETSPDPQNVRVELFDPGSEAGEILRVDLVSRDASGRQRDRLRHLELRRPGADRPHRSPWIRLVGDTIDAAAPGAGHRTLRVGLRDRITIEYGLGALRARHSLRIGRPGDEGGSEAALEGTLRVHLLRMRPGGSPVIGGMDADALRFGQEQVRIANEIWLQCLITFGDPETAFVRLQDPPPPHLLAISDGDGLPARGGGRIRLRIDGRAIRAVTTEPGATPMRTALSIAEAIRDAGFEARVLRNAITDFGADSSADVLVRRRDGTPATLSADGEHPLSTDARQRLEIGRVDLSDGIQDFDNMNAAAGSLEERTMIHGLADDDPATIELFIINAFTSGTRQGEAFIEADRGAIVNALILDWNGILQQRSAWTQSHELGHVLLDQPYHPDNVGADRPWLLMDADSSLPTVTGPKRLTPAECARTLARSGPHSVPAILRPHAIRSNPRQASAPPLDQGYPRGD